jgi:hypothetical protein
VYHQFEIPEDQVPAYIGVEVAKGRNGAPSPGKIAEVQVGDSDSVWAEVEGAGGESTAGKIPA